MALLSVLQINWQMAKGVQELGLAVDELCSGCEEAERGELLSIHHEIYY